MRLSRAVVGTQLLLVGLSCLGLKARMVMAWRDVQAPPATSVDHRYRELRDSLRSSGQTRVGYWSDLPDGEMRFMQAQYALAPILLDRGVRSRYVVADLSDRERIREVCVRLELGLKREYPEALALLEAAPEP